LVGEDLAWVSLQSLGNDAFKSVEIRRLAEDVRSGVAAIERVVDTARLIRAFRASHGGSIAEGAWKEKSPDTFFAPFLL
jgi:hypothetical protein